MKIYMVLSVLAFFLSTSMGWSNDLAPGKVEYGTYINSRYQYEMKYPKKLVFPGFQPDNNDGRGFKSKDKKVELGPEGKHLVVNTWEEEFHSWLDEYKDGKITYKTFNKKLFAFSGYKGDEIFYVRALYLGPDDNPIILIFDASYPRKDKAFWDPIIAYCAKSLKPSKVSIPNHYDLAGLGPNMDQFK